MLGLVLAGNIAMVFCLLGTGRHLLLLPDRLLHRAQERLDRGQQGVHRQPRRRLRHDHRPDGPLVHARARSPSATSKPKTTTGTSSASSVASSAWFGPAPDHRADRARRHGSGRHSRRSAAAIASCRPALCAIIADSTGRSSERRIRSSSRRKSGQGLRLLAAGRRRHRHLLRLRRQECPVPAARRGLPDAMEGPTPVSRPRPLGDDGRRRRLSRRPLLPGLRARSAAGHCHHRPHHAVPRPPRSPSPRPTSSGCWPIRPSANSAT